MPDTGTRVKEIMVQVLDLGVAPEDIGDDASLYSSAIRLDSLGLLRLVVAFEREFGRRIDDEDLMNADLEDVESLVRLVEDAHAAR